MNSAIADLALPARRENHQPILVGVLLAAVIHAVVLVNIEFKLPERHVAHSIAVTLNNVRTQLQDPVIQRLEDIAESAIIQPMAGETEEQLLPQNTLQLINPPPAEEIVQLTGMQLYTRALDAVRHGELPVVRPVRQFNQIPGEPDAEPDFLAPVSVLPVMVSAPRRIEVYDRMGFATVKITDGFGNEVCMQERGDWSDWDAKIKGAADKMKNPALFYRIKNEVCGHLK